MFGRRKQTSTRIDTLLGKAATLNGDLEFSGGLHLDGRVNGNVRSNAATEALSRSARAASSKATSKSRISS